MSAPAVPLSVGRPQMEYSRHNRLSYKLSLYDLAEIFLERGFA